MRIAPKLLILLVSGVVSACGMTAPKLVSSSVEKSLISKKLLPTKLGTRFTGALKCLDQMLAAPQIEKKLHASNHSGELSRPVPSVYSSGSLRENVLWVSLDAALREPGLRRLPFELFKANFQWNSAVNESLVLGGIYESRVN